jgi:dethiobiotin synthetase
VFSDCDQEYAMASLLIVGTDTDAGKTVLVSALYAYFQQHQTNRTVALLKPFQSGMGDRELYQRIFDLPQTAAELNPVYFAAPLAPPIAAAQEGQQVSIATAWTTYQQLSQNYDWVLVEGVGGLGSPVTAQTTVADLAADWRLPIVLVVPVKLGAIGQVVANIALAERSNLRIQGIVRSCITPCTEDELENWASQSLIEELTGVQLLGTLPYLDNPENVEQLVKIASDLDLELLFPEKLVKQKPHKI